MSEAPQKKILRPPYLSIPKIEELMLILTTRTLREFTTEEFKARGFSESDAALAVSMLKFLGLIDENKRPTQLLSGIRMQGKPQEEAFSKLIRDAYSEIFETVEKPYNLSTEELSNEFLARYGLSNRVLRSAVPAFLKLCEYAGFVEKGLVQTRKRENKRAGARKQPVKKAKKSIKESHPPFQDSVSANGLIPISFSDGKLLLSISQGVHDRVWKEIDMRNDWLAIVDAVTNFTEKHLKKKEPPENSEGEAAEP